MGMRLSLRESMGKSHGTRACDDEGCPGIPQFQLGNYPSCFPGIALPPEERSSIHRSEFDLSNARDAGTGFEGSKLAVLDPLLEETPGASDQFGRFRQGQKFTRHGSIVREDMLFKLTLAAASTLCPGLNSPYVFMAKAPPSAWPSHLDKVGFDSRFNHSRGK